MFGDRLKKLREQMGISQRQLAKLIQLSSSAVAMYELDQRSPDKDTIVKLAHLFNCTTDYLLGISESYKPDPHSCYTLDDNAHLSGISESDIPIESRLSNTVIKIPILGTIHTGLSLLADENISGYLDVPDSMRADFALRVSGDSMIGAGILDGDYAICHLSDSPQTGQIILVLKDEGSISEAALKYYFSSGLPKLKSANPTSEELDFTRGYRCVGIMTGLIRQDAPAYQTCQKSLAGADYDGWMKVIEKSSAAGIKPEHLSAHVDMLIEMGKRR